MSQDSSTKIYKFFQLLKTHFRVSIKIKTK